MQNSDLCSSILEQVKAQHKEDGLENSRGREDGSSHFPLQCLFELNFNFSFSCAQSNVMRLLLPLVVTAGICWENAGEIRKLGW